MDRRLFVFVNPFYARHVREKGFTETKWRRSTGRQPGTKSASRPADKPLTNRLLTGCQPRILFQHSVYIGFRLFVLLENRSSDVSSMHWGVRWTLVSWANCSVGAPSCPAPLRRRAVRFDPTRPWYVRVLESTNSNLQIFMHARNCILISTHPLHEQGVQVHMGERLWYPSEIAYQPQVNHSLCSFFSLI